MKGERHYETIREPFTEKQMGDMKDELVRAVGQVKELRGNKSQTLTALGAEIKAAEKSVFDLQQKLSVGYEEIEVEIIYALNEPEPGMKRVINANAGKEIRIEPMTPRERQMELGFGLTDPGEGPQP